MKLKQRVSGQFLILILSGIVTLFMIQIARAQNYPNQSQILQINMPQKTLTRRLIENTSLNYYHQFLGPTVAGRGGESYNVFQEGRTPYQSFHAFNLRHQINSHWAIGSTLAAVNAYGETVTAQQSGIRNKMLRDEFFNARVYVQTPNLSTPIGTLFTTIAYEAPTSNTAKERAMVAGGVLTQSFALALPTVKWTAGINWQYYRLFYTNNNVYVPANAYFPGSIPEVQRLQTTIFSGGPYLGYRFNDKWGVNSSVTFDWDQRGTQAHKNKWNNNLPDRSRLGVSYYPTKYKFISNVGFFTQALVKYTTDTQAVGAELALKF